MKIPSCRSRQARRSARARIAFTLLAALALFLATPAAAVVVKVPFAEISQTADLIFIGTVAASEARLNVANTMIFTDVTFTEVAVVHATEQSVQRANAKVVLTYAGGEVGEVGIEVSDTPRLETGRRYLVFMQDDGRTFSSPVVGAGQGLFEVVGDEAGGRYLVDGAGRAVLSVDGDRPLLSRRRLLSVSGGVPSYEATAAPGPSLMRPSEPGLSVVPSTVAESALERPLPLEDFLSFTVDRAITAPLERRALPPRGSRGKLLKMVDGAVATEDLPAPLPVEAFALVIAGPPEAGQLPGFELPEAGKPLGACGYHKLPLVMEQLPASWPEFALNEQSLYVYNLFMGIYQYSYSNGTVGPHNGQNEFCGYMDDATVSAWGFAWGPSAAMCVNRYNAAGNCLEIYESDILLNAGVSWSFDLEPALGTTSLPLRPAIVHELGHSWGAQTGIYDALFYNFEQPTVMQALYNNVIEYGWGIQPADSYMIRGQYKNQIGVPATRDVGVESYYAPGGLANATTTYSDAFPGGTEQIRNVTVTNMSHHPVSQFSLRFYLSTDRVITTDDYRIPGTFKAASLPAEYYETNTYNVQLPTAIPPGEYYVGALVTIDGFGPDDFAENNTTTLYSKLLVHPATPTGLQATDGTVAGGIRLTWNAVPGAVTYEVLRGETADVAAAVLWAQNLTDTSWLDSDPSTLPKKTFRYWVYARSVDFGTGLVSQPDSGHRKFAAPVSVDASDDPASDRVSVSWQAVGGAASYDVFRNTANTKLGASQVATAVTALGWQNPGAVPFKTYYYWVRSRNAYGVSALSAGNSGMRGLIAPSNIKATNATSDSRVRVTWDSVPGATNYELWRNTFFNPATATKLTLTNGNAYNDTATVPLRTYYYWVKAWHSGGTSPLSALATGKRNLVAPAALLATDGTLQDRVRLTWSKVPIGTGYRVYRRPLALTGGAFEQIALINSAAVASYDDLLPCGGDPVYEYQVNAFNGYGSGRASAIDAGRTGGCPPLQVVTPNGGEKLHSGRGYDISWRPQPQIATVTIQYSLTGRSSWQTIVEKRPATAIPYRWTPPPASSATCLVKVIAFDGEGRQLGWDTSDAYFAITTVDVGSPDGGEVFNPGAGVQIQWLTYKTAAPVTAVQVWFSSFEGASWQLVKSLPGNPGKTAWTVPTVFSERCLIKVTLKDVSGRVVGSDRSAAFFTVQPALLILEGKSEAAH